MDNDWYDNIEPGVRDIVRVLRNRGINTFCSCEHDMTIECESYDASSEADIIYNCLVGDFDDYVKDYKAILTLDYSKNGYYFKRWIIEIKKYRNKKGR